MNALAKQSDDLDFENELVNLARCAMALSVSTTTLTEWVNDPDLKFPVVERGGNGRAYQFRLGDVVEWYRQREQSNKAAAEREQAAAVQARLALFGEEHEPETVVMSARDRLREAEAIMAMMKVATQRRELISARKVDIGIAKLIGVVQKMLGALTDQAALTMGLTGAQQEALQAIIDQRLEDLADAVARMNFEDNGGGR